MHLNVRHTTTYTYDPEANGIGLRLKLFPANSAAQSCSDWAVTVNGDIVEPLLTDAAGDRSGLWHSPTPQKSVEIVASGTFATTDTAGVLRDVREAMPPAVYLRDTKITEPSPAIRALADGIEADDTLAKLHVLSEAVAEAVAYKSGATDAATTAAEAIVLAEGVCQDQAHVFIAAARCMGIPARYVAGYLLDPDLDDDATEQTHAWAEAHVGSLGWVGFDITHQLCPTDAYVRLASGFDADDAAPIRGTFVGEIAQTLTTAVQISQATAQSQQ